MNFRRYEKLQKLLKNSAQGAIISLSRLISGFIRGKVTALALGAAGVGIFSQANQLSLLGLTLASLSMASGVINRMSVHEEGAPEHSQSNVMATAFTVQFTLCALLAIFGVIFSKGIAIGIFGSEDYQPHCIMAILGIPFTTLASGYLQCLFVDPKRYSGLVSASIWANFVGLAFFIPLVRSYGLKGAFMGLFLNSFFQFLFYLVHLKKFFSLKFLFRFGLDSSELRFLMKFASVGLVMSMVQYGSNLLIRSFVLKEVGPVANGILQVPIALCAYYSPFLNDVLWVQLYPMVSKNKDSAQSRESLHHILKYTLALQTAIAISVLVSQEFFIRLAYSASFLDAVRLIPLQLLGDYFFYLLQVFSVYYLGASFFKENILGWFLYYGVLAAASLAAIRQFGIVAVPITYTVVTAIFSFAILFAFIRKHREDSGAMILHILGCLVTLLVSVGIVTFGFPWGARLIPFFIFGTYFYFTSIRSKGAKQ